MGWSTLVVGLSSAVSVYFGPKIVNSTKIEQPKSGPIFVCLIIRFARVTGLAGDRFCEWVVIG